MVELKVVIQEVSPGELSVAVVATSQVGQTELEYQFALLTRESVSRLIKGIRTPPQESH